MKYLLVILLLLIFVANTSNRGLLIERICSKHNLSFSELCLFKKIDSLSSLNFNNELEHRIEVGCLMTDDTLFYFSGEKNANKVFITENPNGVSIHTHDYDYYPSEIDEKSDKWKSNFIISSKGILQHKGKKIINIWNWEGTQIQANEAELIL